MLVRLGIAFLLSLVALECCAAERRMPFVHFGRPVGGRLNVRLPRNGIQADDGYPKIENYTISQPIDHDDQSVGNYIQRYQYNGNYFDAKADPSVIFLMIGGESTATDIWIQANYSYIVWAQKYHAAVFQLEHRFFGYSRPFGDTKTEHLKYLNVHQAMEDIVSFIKAMNDKYKFKNPKWVTFGGSYPGMLDAWFRQTYPNLTAGAVASSAPLDIELDSYVYNIVVENVIKNTSQACYDAFSKGFHSLIKKSLTAEGRAELNEKLKLDPPFDESKFEYRDLINLITNVNEDLSVVVQYTYDGRSQANINGFDVSNMCANVSGTDDDILRLRRFIDWFFIWTEGAANLAFQNSYQDVIDQLKDDTWADIDNTEMRTWMWLCCNELGAMVSSDLGRNMFGNMMPLNFFIDQCTDVFGDTITAEYVREHTSAFKKKYNGCDTYKTTNIVLPNGLDDPWSYQGCKAANDTAGHMYAVLMPGVAHCADMYPVYKNEPPSLARARAAIASEIEYYIGWKKT